jgi:hypothetical protein
VTEHRAPRNRMKNLRRSGFHPRAFAGGEDNSKGGAGHGIIRNKGEDRGLLSINEQFSRKPYLQIGEMEHGNDTDKISEIPFNHHPGVMIPNLKAAPFSPHVP